MSESTTPQTLARTPYVSRVRSTFDKLGFLIATAAGAIGIISLKVLGLPQPVVTLFPLGVMALYALILWRAPRLQLRDDQAGDNIYYLGFLYTLVSLSHALYVFTPEAGAGQIIGNFGIALATTIFGLALRVVFNQMRQDPVEVEREARLELAAASSRLRTELDGVVLDMNHFRRATQQSIAEGFEALLAKASEGVGKNATRFEETAAAMMEKLGQAFEAFTANSTRLNDISANVVTAIEFLIDRVEKIEAPADLLTTKLEPALEAIREAGEEIKKRVRGDERQMARLAKAIETSISGAEGLSARAEALGTIAAQAGANIEALNNQARDNQAIQSSLFELMSQAEKLVSGQSAAAQTMQQTVEGLAGRIGQIAAGWERESQAVIEQVAAQGTAARSQIAENVGALQAEQQASLKQTSDILAQTLRAVQEHSRELAKELETSRRYTQQVHGALVEMTGELARRLEPAAPARDPVSP